jgi:hypothetical protein
VARFSEHFLDDYFLPAGCFVAGVVDAGFGAGVGAAFWLLSTTFFSTLSVILNSSFL